METIIILAGLALLWLGGWLWEQFNGSSNYTRHKREVPDQSHQLIENKKYWDKDFEGKPVDPSSKWGQVREKVFERDKYTCQSCGGNKNPTVHHKVPKSVGGDNSLSNLTLLCEACHGNIHGTAIMPSSFQHDPNYGEKTSSSPIVKKLVRAVNNGSDIEITYKDAKGKLTKRKIAPMHMFKEHGHIYVRAHCLLRKADRTFLVDRILSKKPSAKHTAKPKD